MQTRVPIVCRRYMRRDQHRPAGIEQHRVQCVGGGHVLAGLGVRHDGQIGEPRLLRDEVLLPAGDRGETGGGVIAAGMRLRARHVVLR